MFKIPKNRANDVAALLSNWENVEAAVKSASEAEGSAARENAKYVDSIQGRLDKMTTSWQSFANTFMSSDFLKGAISALTSFIEGLEKIIDTVGTFPTLMGTIAAGFSLFKNGGIFKTLTSDLDGFINKIGIANRSFADLANAFNFGKTSGGLKGGLSAIKNSLSGGLTKSDIANIQAYNKEIRSGTSAQTAWYRTMQTSSKSAQGLVESAKGSEVALNGMKAATIGSKVALIGAKAAAVAFNAALTMGISLLIDWAASGIQEILNAKEKLAEKVEELTSKFKEQHEELKKLQSDYDTSDESSMVSKYERLSRGVDNLGRNVSLTSDEYSEYQSIVNKIADQIPSLVSGYDEQGNALLSVKGNVDELTEAYEKLIHAQNQGILTKTGDIEKSFGDVLENASGEGWLDDNHGLWKGLLGDGILYPFATFADYELKEDTVEDLQALLNAKSEKERQKILDEYELLTFDPVTGEIGGNRFGRLEIEDMLESAGYEVDLFESPIDVLKEVLEEDPDKIQEIIDNYYRQFDGEVEKQKTIAIAKLSEAFDISSEISGLDYGNISEDLQAVAYQTIGNLDYGFFKNLSESGKTVEQWTREMLDQLNSLSEFDNTQIEAGFELQTQFNGGEISYGEYVKNLQGLDEVVDGLNLKSEAKEQLKISLGLDEDGVIDQYNNMVKRLTDSKNYDFNISDNEAKKLLDSLSSEELAIAVNVITDLSNNDYAETAEEIRTAIDRELAIKGLSLDLSIEVEKTKLEELATAISESFSGSGLSDESISAVEGMFSDLSSYDPSKLFERTANGIRLNSEEYRKLNSEYKKTNIAKVNKEMDSLGNIYNQTREELYRLTYGTDEYNAKASELSGIEEQIKNLEQLAAGYEGLASAYQEWQMVEAAGSQRDMYESIIEGFENIDDEISRGWYDDGTIEFLELLSGKDLSTAGIEEVKKAYKGLGEEIEHTSYSVRDFFTVDDDGNSTNAGVYNFLDAIGQLEEEAFGGKDVVQRDGKGNIIGFDFQVVGGDEVVAEALGISEELVQIMVRAADDAGFVVSMDGTYQQLDILKEKAQEAAESLNRTLEGSGKKGFDFDFNTSNVDDIKKQLVEAQKILDTFRNTDGTINTRLEGADEALTVASTLQSMLDKLTRPAYMDIEVNQVEDELQEPLRNLQELRRLTETEHQLKLSGGDTTKLKADIDELYTELDNLPDETKIEIGLVDENKQPLTGKALKNKINDIVSGEAELGIKATVDIQLEMDEKLGILVDKALLDAGIIDDEEFKKRVDIYLEADVDDKDAKNKTEQAIDDVVKNTKSDVENAKVNIKTNVNNVKSEAKSAKTDIKTEVSNVKSEVENIKAEIASAKSEVEVLAKSLQALKDLPEETSVTVTANLYGNVPDLDEAKQTDDLLMFAAGAEALKDLPEETSVTVTANLYGNVPDLDEAKQTDDLLMFAAGAEALKDLPEETSVTVTAQLNGNVKDLKKGKLSRFIEFAGSAKQLEELKAVGSFTTHIDADVEAHVKGNVVGIKEKAIDNLSVFADHAKILKLANVNDTKVSVKADIKGNVKDIKEKAIDNLSVFAKHAKALNDVKGLDKTSVTVTAKIKGNVIYIKEKAIDNLSVFAKHAKKLNEVKGLDGTSVTVKAQLDGNVKDIKEKAIDNLSVFAKHAKALSDVKNLNGTNVSVTANINGNVKDKKEKAIDNLSVFAKQVEALSDVEYLDGTNVTVTANINGNVISKKEKAIDNLSVFAKHAKALSDVKNLDGTSVTVKAQLDGNVKDKKEKAIDNLSVFAKHAKKLNEVKGLDGTSVTVKAQLDGNVKDIKEKAIDNLSVFAKHAKALSDVKNLNGTNVSVTANINGNVKDKKEKAIDNLSVFAKQVEALSDVEYLDGTNVTVTANINGNVISKKEKAIDNLSVFAKHAKALSDVKNLNGTNVSVTANINGNVKDKKEKAIDNLSVFAKHAKKLNEVKGLDGTSVTVKAQLDGNVKDRKETAIDNLSAFATHAKALSEVSDFTRTITANAKGNIIEGENAQSNISSLIDFNSIISTLSPNQSVTISVTANVDSENVNKAIQLLKDVSNSGLFKDYKATVKVGATVVTIDDTVVQNYKVPKKNGKVAYAVDSSKIDAWTAPSKEGVVNYSAKVEALTDSQKHKTGTITYKANVVGGGVATGTAHANGSASGRAFARGNWGVKGNGVALGGELGRELVVRDGRFFTIGDKGAEFFRYKKNDIVFNAAQTESLFKYGGIKGVNPRGKMLAGGTAFTEGNAFKIGSTGTGGAGKVDGNSVTGQSYGSSSSNNFEEVIDWIEVIIDRVERAIDKFDQQANNIYKSWSSRNIALQNQISEVGKEIGLQQQAYQKYMDAANGVGLSSSWAEKIRNGEIDIEAVTDETLAEKIDDYQKWYEKALGCKDAIEELREEESKLFAQRFENIQTQYDGILQGYEHTEAMLNEYISQAEEQGYIVSKKYYQALIDNEESNIAELKKEQADLIAERDNAIDSGAIVKGSEAWLEQCASIDEVTQAIEESTTALLEYDNAMRDIDWQIFDLIQERISDVTEEADFLIELMSNKKLFDDDGKLTSQGLATMGLYAQNYNTHMYQADEYGAEVAKLDAQIAKDPYDQELINRKNELLELQRESILAAEDEKNAIRDMVEEGINLELDALQERIDKYNESIDAAKDLYDYQRDVQKQSEEIASLEKQRAAYLGNDSEEGKAKLQEIEVSLKEAKENLQETEYDKYISDQQALLDTLYNEYELILNTRLDNVDYLLEQVIASINTVAGADGTIASALGSEGAIAIAVSNNATSIKDTLTSEANKVGTVLSNAMNSIWNTGDGNAKSVLTMYGEDFRTKSTTVNTTLNGIKSSVNSMVSSLNKDAQKNATANKTTTSAKKDPTKTATKESATTKKTTTKKSSSGDGKPKVGDKVKFVSGQYYYDSQGKKPLGSHNKGEYVYITKINKRNWATHPYHIATDKAGKHPLGWLKLSQISGYATGKKNFLDDEIAWTQENGREYIVRPSDGAILTPVAKGDSVLTSTASNNIWDMANSPAEFIKDNLSLGTTSVPNNSNVQNSCVQHFENVIFSMPNVHNYGELLSEMQRDKNFEKLILSMTVEQIAGKSSLAKGKSIRH